MNQRELAKHLFNQSINNLELIGKGKNPVSIEIVGPAGISKTSTCSYIGKLLSERFGEEVYVHAINGAELGTNVDWLNGYPILEHLFKIDDKEVWVPDSVVNTLSGEYVQNLGQSRQAAGAPEFVQRLYEHKYSILILDDIGRCQQIVFNALMELINQRKYGTWQLPDNCLVFTTANKDADSNNERDQDDAQMTRKRVVEITSLDIEAWTEDFANDNLNPYACEFARHYWNNNLSAALKNNIRQYTNFANSIDLALSDFIKINNLETSHKTEFKDITLASIPVEQRPVLFNRKDECLAEIRLCGAGLGEKNIIINLFIVEFLTNLLSKLSNIEMTYGKITPDKFVEQIKNDIGDGNIMIANIQLRRIFNHVIYSQKPLTKEQCLYFTEIIASNLFSPSAIKYFIETYVKKNRSVFAPLQNNAELNKRIFKAANMIS